MIKGRTKVEAFDSVRGEGAAVGGFFVDENGSSERSDGVSEEIEGGAKNSLVCGEMWSTVTRHEVCKANFGLGN